LNGCAVVPLVLVLAASVSSCKNQETPVAPDSGPEHVVATPPSPTADPRTMDLPEAIEDWIRLLEADQLSAASEKWAKNTEVTQQMVKFWTGLQRCHKQFDYRKWVESAKNAHGVTTFKVGGHEYGCMHTDWEKTPDGWRINHVWECR